MKSRPLVFESTVLGAIALGCSASVGACSDQHADAVVRIETNGPPRTSGFAGSTDGGEGGAAPDAPDPGRETLCQRCDSHWDCGDSLDRCVEVDDRWYCGMQCGFNGACPDGFECQDVLRNVRQDSWQCVPRANSVCESPPSLEEMRSYVLNVVNGLRARRDLEPMKMTDCLNELGQESVVEFEARRTQYTKFDNECSRLIPNCDCGWQAEYQAVPGVSTRSWQDAIREHIEAASTDPSSFGANVVSKEWDELGVGLLLREDQDDLWMSLEFAP